MIAQEAPKTLKWPSGCAHLLVHIRRPPVNRCGDMRHAIPLTTWSVQKKLLASKSGKWNVDHYRKITLYGHDAQNMKQFTLHFQSIAQHTLDRPWFGEVWYPVEKGQPGAQYAQTHDNIVDPQELDLEPGHQDPERCFSWSRVRTCICASR